MLSPLHSAIDREEHEKYLFLPLYENTENPLTLQIVDFKITNFSLHLYVYNYDANKVIMQWTCTQRFYRIAQTKLLWLYRLHSIRGKKFCGCAHHLNMIVLLHRQFTEKHLQIWSKITKTMKDLSLKYFVLHGIVY